MKKLTVFLLFLSFYSCIILNKDGIEVTIINKTQASIRNVEFSTTEKLDVLKMDNIQPNELVTGFLSMNKNKSDGAYILTFKRAKGEKNISQSGYYSNGMSLNAKAQILIKKDTVLITFSSP